MSSNTACSPHPDDSPAKTAKKPLYLFKTVAGEKAWDAKVKAVTEIKTNTGKWPTKDDPEHGGFMEAMVTAYGKRKLDEDRFLKLKSVDFPRTMLEIIPPHPLGDTPLGRVMAAYEQGRPGEATKADVYKVRETYRDGKLGEVSEARLRTLGFPF